MVDVAPGGSFELGIASVRKRIGDARCACSPTTALSQDRPCAWRRARRSRSTSSTRAISRRRCTGTACAWTNRSDGTHETQAPIPIGGRFSCTRRVPGPGPVLVPPAHPRGLRPGDGPVRQRHRRARRPGVLGAGEPRVGAHARRRADRGRPDRARSAARRRRTRRWAASATCCSSPESPSSRSRRRQGEVVRLYLTNTANTRVFKVKLPGARMKLVGGDSGRCEREEFVEEVDPGAVGARDPRRAVRARRPACARAPHAREGLPARIDHSPDEPAEPSLAEAFEQLRTRPGAQRRARGPRSPPVCRARQDAGVRRRDGLRRARRRRRGLHLPHAPRGRLGGAGPMPELRHEAHGDDPHVHVPHASRGRLRGAAADARAAA